MTRFLVYALVFIGCTSSKNEIINKGDIEIKILDQELYLVGNEINLDIQIINNTDSSFLMFAFGLLHEGLSKESYYAKSLNYPAGTAIFIYDGEGNALEQHEPELGEVDFDDVYDLKIEADKVYVDRMLSLKSDTTIELSLDFNLRYFKPEPSVYDIFLIHYAGQNLKHFVPDEKVKEMEQEYGASVFQGWVKSNKVKLIVE